MARDDNRIWYETMRKLGVPPGTKPLSPREALDEYANSPALPPPPHAGEDSDDMEFALNHPFEWNGSHSRSRRSKPRRVATAWLVAAGVAAVALVGALPFLAGRLSSGGGSGGGDGASSAAAPVVEPNAGEEGTPKGEKPVGKAGGMTVGEPGEKGAPKGEKPADKGAAGMTVERRGWQHSEVERTADGGFRIDGRSYTLADAEEHFSHLETPYLAAGDNVVLATTHGIDFGERMVVTADAAFRAAHQFFGKAPELPNGPMSVFVADGLQQYNELASAWGGDEKSSAFYAFATPWLDEYGEMGMASVTQFSQADSLTEVYVTHATAEQFVRRLIGRDAADVPPRWFIDGVASYLGRWQKPALFEWSRGRLGSLGGAVELKSWLSRYAPNEHHILNGGALIAFLKSPDCPDDLRGEFEQAIIAVNDGKKVSKAFRKLEKALVKHEDDFKDYIGL